MSQAAVILSVALREAKLIDPTLGF